MVFLIKKSKNNQLVVKARLLVIKILNTYMNTGVGYIQKETSIKLILKYANKSNDSEI